MIKKKCIIFLFISLSSIFNVLLFGDYMEIDVLFKKDIEPFCDVALTKDNIVISFPKKYLVYNLFGEEIKVEKKLIKSYSRKIFLMNDKIVNILSDKHLLQVFQDSEIIKEINLKDIGISIIFSSIKISESSILLLTDILEEENDEKYFHHYLIKMDINTGETSIISDFGREKSSLDYIFKQDPINEKLSNIIIGKKEFIIIDKDSIFIRDLDNNLFKKRKVEFRIVIIDKDIKKYYDKKKPFIMKFIYPENSPRIYKLYPLSDGKYLIDTWEEKSKRIKNPNLDQFILFHYDSVKDEIIEVLTEYNPDYIKKIKDNKIAIYSDSELLIGEIVIKDERPK